MNQQTGTDLQYSGESSVDVLDPVSLEKVCVPKCRDDLRDLRAKIVSTYKKQTDLITYENKGVPLHLYRRQATDYNVRNH